MEEDQLHVRIGICLFDEAGNGAPHGNGEGVAPLGPAQHDFGEGGGEVETDGGHGIPGRIEGSPLIGGQGA